MPPSSDLLPDLFLGRNNRRWPETIPIGSYGINILTHMNGCFFNGFHVSTYTIHGSYGSLFFSTRVKVVTLEGRTYHDHEEFLFRLHLTACIHLEI